MLNKVFPTNQHSFFSFLSDENDKRCCFREAEIFKGSVKFMFQGFYGALRSSSI